MAKNSPIQTNANLVARAVFSKILTYSTVREASITNKTVAVIYRLIQLSILVYMIG